MAECDSLSAATQQTVLFDGQAQQQIKRLIRRLGIPTTYKGFSYLVFAVGLALENEARLLHVTKDIYPVVACQYQTSKFCVEKNLRTAINIFWERGNTKLLAEMVGYEMKDKPGTGEFIDAVAGYFRDHNDLLSGYDVNNLPNFHC